MAILVDRHILEIVSASTAHGVVQVYVDDGELWIRQGADSISMGRNAGLLVAGAIMKTLGAEGEK